MPEGLLPLLVELLGAAPIPLPDRRRQQAVVVAVAARLEVGEDRVRRRARLVGVAGDRDLGVGVEHLELVADPDLALPGHGAEIELGVVVALLGVDVGVHDVPEDGLVVVVRVRIAGEPGVATPHDELGDVLVGDVDRRVTVHLVELSHGHPAVGLVGGDQPRELEPIGRQVVIERAVHAVGQLAREPGYFGLVRERQHRDPRERPVVGGRDERREVPVAGHEAPGVQKAPVGRLGLALVQVGPARAVILRGGGLADAPLVLPVGRVGVEHDLVARELGAEAGELERRLGRGGRVARGEIADAALPVGGEDDGGRGQVGARDVVLRILVERLARPIVGVLGVTGLERLVAAARELARAGAREREQSDEGDADATGAPAPKAGVACGSRHRSSLPVHHGTGRRGAGRNALPARWRRAHPEA